ncbi:MAG: hypothetical protein KME27_14535 [Lyngbya sp. HA4199-MV5]|jgi:heme/copper-type cytochrome/quinol oxidase subunit 2|nr:hypothetical protein [Lyngbya sp. HA4199-MV5]
MTRSNSPSEHLITMAAIFVAVYSSIISISSIQEAMRYGSDLNDILPLLPPTVIITLTGYKWLWIGVVLSSLVGVMYHRRRITRRQALTVLGGITVVNTLYLLLMVFAAVFPMFRVYEQLG